MNASDVMVHDVVTIGTGATVAEAAKLMIENDISALPVVDEQGGLVGLLSEADLLRREEVGTEKKRPWWVEALMPATTLAGEFAKSHGTRVFELMSPRVISAAPDTPLGEIATLLERNRIKRVPIVDDRGKLVGIVSRANLVQALASASPVAAEAPHRDRAIRSEILARLKDQQWSDFGDRNIVVRDGKVRVWGLVGSPQERKALLALVEGVPGVIGVEDEMFPAY